MRLLRSLMCAALVLSPSILFAQSYTGTLAGTVKDTSGAVIPHAAVTITRNAIRNENTSTSAFRTTSTDWMEASIHPDCGTTRRKREIAFCRH